VAECAAILRRGSRSFHAASLLLPARVRGPAAAVYAFCREADDAVDRDPSPDRALGATAGRLDRVYAGAPDDRAVDRALAAVVRSHRLPREPFDAMLEGFAWDVSGRRYPTEGALLDYCVRVAGTVGVLMTLLMGERRAGVLSRACDLGVAMQLTNIARDVGEDAREGRVYIPLAWLEGIGLDAGDVLGDPRFRPEVGLLVRRLLARAEGLYARADRGVAMLPRDCRVAIRAARLVYADIGRSIVRAGYDTIGPRAHTTGRRKAWLLLRAGAEAASRTRAPDGEPALDEARALVEAVASGGGSR